MPVMRTPIRIELSAEERAELERTVRSHTAQHRHVIRARTILLLGQGETVSAVARTVGRQRRIVRKWANRFIHKRLTGLHDLPRSGRPALFSPCHSDTPDQVSL